MSRALILKPLFDSITPFVNRSFEELLHHIKDDIKKIRVEEYILTKNPTDEDYKKAIIREAYMTEEEIVIGILV